MKRVRLELRFDGMAIELRPLVKMTNVRGRGILDFCRENFCQTLLNVGKYTKCL